MATPTTGRALTRADLEALDRFYREGGLRAMASPHVHYDDPSCPHPGCPHQMEWIDFKLELHGDPEAIYKPLVRAWWEGSRLHRPLPEWRPLDPIHDHGNGGRPR